MTSNTDLVRLLWAIGSGDPDGSALLAATPELATAALGKGRPRANADEFFLDACATQVYVGDTALHVAASAYELDMARALLTLGADVHARNRRGAQPLHAAVRGGPGSRSWEPERQGAVITLLIEAGAEVDARAAGGVTPLHRAVRNRCSLAVRLLLDAGAEPLRTNDSGSTALDLTRWTTGRGGTGTPEAKAEQARIVSLLTG